jgi:hypothetical protein
VAGGCKDETNAPHSGAISASEGRLATLTSCFVSAIACLSNDAILIASFIDESVKLGIGQRTVHVAVDLRKIAVDIVGAQQNFQSTAAAHQAWKSRHQTVTRHQSSAHFPLRQNRIFAARKPHS